jgi:nitrogen regulatory protein P-II 1
MKKIEAIIRHFKLDDVKAALMRVGVQGMTVAEVRGCGRARPQPELYRGQEYAVDFQPRVKLEVVVGDENWRVAVQALAEAARTGQVGDGRIFVSSLDEVVRVRTGETGPQAI